MMIKEAVKNLYDRKEITEEEYNFLKENIEELEKSADVTIHLPGARIGEETVKATTGIGRFLKNLKGPLPLAGVAAGGLFAGSELYKYLKQQSDIANSYKTMQEKIPSLTEYPQDKIKDYFEVVKTFSPKSASNPLVAGALVHKMLEFGGVDHKLVQDLSKMEISQPGIMYELAKASIGGMAQPPKGE
jgi:hypothetical protein